VLGASLLLLAAACAQHAASPPAADAVREPSPDPAFLAMSQVLTGHADIDALTAARLSDAFATLAPDVHAQIRTLCRTIRAGMTPDAALAAADGVGLKAVALTVVAAWYTGTAGSGPKAITVAYRDALMQRPVADALIPPTYALGGPAWWTAEPPEVGLTRPTVRAPNPPTTGTPEPKKS
jgi:hypothetical protein